MEKCYDYGDKYSLRAGSPTGLKRKIWEDNKKGSFLDGDERKLACEDSEYSALTDLLPKDFEWITTEARLFEEGEIQQNCVYSYRGKIKRDLLAVVHWTIEDRAYTIEIRKDAEGHFVLYEMKGFRNSEPSMPDLCYAEGVIDNMNFTIEEMEEEGGVDYEIIEELHREMKVPIVVE